MDCALERLVVCGRGFAIKYPLALNCGVAAASAAAFDCLIQRLLVALTSFEYVDISTLVKKSKFSL